MTALKTQRRSRKRRAKYYGVGTLAEGLYNLRIGPNGWKLGYRELVQHAGTINSISAYCITGGGYSLGTGGSMSCRVETDNAGLPSGTLVSAGATVTIATPTTSAIRTWAFTTPPVVTVGTVIHYVFTNEDASPTLNYVSLDCIDVSGYARLPQPTIPDAYAYTNYFDSGAWIHANEFYFPIYRTLYADGFKGGYSTYEVSVVRYIGGNQKVRQNFTPTVAQNVRAVSVAVAKYTSTSAVLTINLRNLTGATLVDSGTIAAASINLGDNVRYGCRHARLVLTTPVTLAAGTNYALELTSTEAVNPYMTAASRRGGVPASFGALLDSDNRDLDSLFEYTTDGTTWLTETGQSQLQAFFEVV